MSVDVTKRFIQHCSGKGAKWTQLHKPVRIHEIRETKIVHPKKAARLEDLLTLDIALLYGENNVRGGKWCRVFCPTWPKYQ